MKVMETLWETLSEEIAGDEERKRELEEEMEKEKQRHAEEMKKEKQRHAEEMEKEKQRHAEEMKGENATTGVINEVDTNQDRITPENFLSHGIEDTSVNIRVTLRKTKNSVYDKCDDKWCIKKATILHYLDASIQNDKWNSKQFLTYIYKNYSYREWSENRKNQGVNFRKNYTTGEYVIGAGNCFKNWKTGKGEWHCESFHFIKQVYDAMKKKK